MTITREGGIAVAVLSVVVPILVTDTSRAQTPSISARAETLPVPSSGDAADDSVVWVHPTMPGLSTVIGTDKDSGIAVYDLAGNQLQFLADGELNNVDLRHGFPLPPAGVALVTSGERSQNRLAIYAVDPNTRTLQDVAARNIALGVNVYGCCMYHSPVTGDYYFFGTTDNGGCEQWRLFVDSVTGLVDAVHVRSFQVGGTVEGCVADDENAWLFVAEENTGIWRYGAEPGTGTARVLVDSTGSGGNLTADVEGLSIYYAAAGGGYLLASSQGNDTYVVYDRAPPHGYVFTFGVGANTALGIDGVTHTDGIDVMNLGLGSAFPSGLFVVQDDDNPGANQNFKLVSWADIAGTANPPLLVDTTYDVQGARYTAWWTYRNGSGANPLILTNLLPPTLGTTWASDLDCAGLPPGLAALYGFDAPGAGQFIAGGELLVDPTSFLVLPLWAPQAGNTVRFSVTLPRNPVLYGVALHVQGACLAPPRLVLSNAIDLRLGF